MQGPELVETVDAVVVGAGFSGVYALYRLHALGLNVVALEQGSGVGGVWYWNRYPGARCDAPSVEYSYSFDEGLEQEWHWSERFASQPEIERYINHVTERFGLRELIRFDTTVTSAQYRSEEHGWRVYTAAGAEYRCRYVVMAVGSYSDGLRPDLDGLDEFAGELHYSHHWPGAGVDVAGKRVGVIGTGSSGMQIATAVSGLGVGELYVFQRTANFCVPGHNAAMDESYERRVKEQYPSIRDAARLSSSGIAYARYESDGLVVGSKNNRDLDEAEFRRRMDAIWNDPGGMSIYREFQDVFRDPVVNGRISTYIRDRIRERVFDPAVAEALCPHGYYLGTRRLLVENGYLEIYNRENVTLVDVGRDPIQRIEPGGVQTKRAFYALDVLILATGFDTGTGAVLRIECTGTDGELLSAHWAAGPSTFLGLSAAGFPNLFVLSGPGCPGVQAQGVILAEVQVDFMSGLIEHMRSHGYDAVDASPVAEKEWTEHVAETAAGSLITEAESQYTGANVPGKPRVYLAYLGGFGTYYEFCGSVADRGYNGYTFQQGDKVIEADWAGPPHLAS
jgi:cyclohexanone monooxygenase